MTSRALPRLELVFAALLFSTGGAAIKAISLSAWQVACLRSGIAAVALFLFLPAARRGLSLSILGWSIAYAATLVLFVSANKLTTSANAIFLQSTAPLYVLVLAPLVLGERMQKNDLGAMLAVALGLALVFASQDAPAVTAPQPLRGNLLAALSGLTFAIGILGMRRLSRGDQDRSLAMVTLGNALACAATLPLALPIEGARPIDWGILVFLGVIQIGLAYVLVTAGLKRVPAFEASLWLLVEPALNPVWTWSVHGERPGALALVGGVVILVATALKARADVRAPATG